MIGKKISVIIPVYKVENYLDECVQSVLHQTYRNLEIILVDDGSPDRCGQMCDAYAEKDERIKVVHKENGGLSDARNAGLDVATGEYIAFLDSDDYIDTKMYEELYYSLNNTPNAYLVASPIIRNRDGVFSPFKIGSVEYENNKVFSIEEYMRLFLGFQLDSASWNKLYKREFIKYKFKKGRTNEDYLFLYYNCKAWCNSNVKYVMNSHPHYYYRSRIDSICYHNKKMINPLLVDVVRNCEEIIEDLYSWNKTLIPFVYNRMEDSAIRAKRQIVLFPLSKEKYPKECIYINEVLFNQLHLFKCYTSLKNKIRILLFRYAPCLFRTKYNFCRK